MLRDLDPAQIDAVLAARGVAVQGHVGAESADVEGVESSARGAGRSSDIHNHLQQINGEVLK